MTKSRTTVPSLSSSTAHAYKKNTKIGERDAIAIMQDAFERARVTTDDGNDDDVGYAALTDHTSVAVNTDTMVQSTDMPPNMTLRQAARKSVISCISDFAAKGIRPKFVTISVNMPKNTNQKDASDVAQGFADALKAYNIKIVAGDMNAGTEFVFNVCMMGGHAATKTTAAKKTRRRGAQIGNRIFVTGPFGYTALGLDVLLKNHAQDGQDKKNTTVIKNAVKSVLYPDVHLDFMVQCATYATSSMDSSDGLAATLNEMAMQSQCEFEIHTMPTTRQIAKYAQRHNKKLEELVFNGGEEYETVFTVHPSDIDSIMKLAKKFKVCIIEIGIVTKRTAKKSERVYMKNKNATVTRRRTVIKASGWDHFAQTNARNGS